MNLPETGDYINIHTHGASKTPGIFSVDNIMAHEGRRPIDVPGIAYTYGIHPWFLSNDNHDQLINSVIEISGDPRIIAIGEAGLDKLKGASPDLQVSTFEEQIAVSEERRKPLIIHCVRAWDELLVSHKKLCPEMPWLVHGFRGSVELARQLLSKGMYLSFWFDFVLRAESADLLRSLPENRIFLETDGADVDIRDIYIKVSGDLDHSVEELKTIIFSNFKEIFCP